VAVSVEPLAFVLVERLVDKWEAVLVVVLVVVLVAELVDKWVAGLGK